MKIFPNIHYKTLPLSAQSGFTLIELIVVVAIIAILASITMPAYRNYVIRNSENQAQAKMKQLQLELESWRANSLTYKGFKPKTIDNTGKVVFAYDDATNTKIAVPNAAKANYTITLLADTTGTNSLATANNSFSYTTTGNAWRMLAVPSASMLKYGADNILLTSTGLACKGSVTITDTKCDTSAGGKVW